MVDLGAADAPGDLLVGQPELLDQRPVRGGFLHGAEIRPLEVLDQGDLELRPIGELADDGRDALEAGEPGRPEAALARDELVAVEGLGDEDGLEDAVLADAGREGLELVRVEPLSWLAGIGLDPREGDLRHAVRLGALRDQRRETTAQAALPLGMDRHERAPIAAGSEAGVLAGAAACQGSRVATVSVAGVVSGAPGLAGSRLSRRSSSAANAA